MSAPSEWINRLCPNCALCCNGVLFADVRLREEDDAPRLAAKGITLKWRGKLARFQQPCTCLEGNRCRIYKDRPERCRTFECRLLQRTERGEASKSAALKIIQQARRRADNVRRILRELGDTDETLPLSYRYQRMMQQPIDLSADESISALRGKLMLAVGELVGVLEANFLK